MVLTQVVFLVGVKLVHTGAVYELGLTQTPKFFISPFEKGPTDFIVCNAKKLFRVNFLFTDFIFTISHAKAP